MSLVRLWIYEVIVKKSLGVRILWMDIGITIYGTKFLENSLTRERNSGASLNS